MQEGVLEWNNVRGGRCGVDAEDLVNDGIFGNILHDGVRSVCLFLFYIILSAFVACLTVIAL
jgi:hypothetical protein